ncbi:MAG: pilin [bacterium]|nr:pilin [bacterium]
MLTKKILLKTVLAVVVFAILFGVGDNVIAQSNDTYVPLAPIEGTFAESTGKTSLTTYIAGAFRIAIALCGVLAFLMIVIGGFQYMSTDAIGGKTEGKERILQAVGGLVLALSSWLIINTLNPELLSLEGINKIEPLSEKIAQTNLLSQSAPVPTIGERLREERREVESLEREAEALQSAGQTEEAEAKKDEALLARDEAVSNSIKVTSAGVNRALQSNDPEEARRALNTYVTSVSKRLDSLRKQEVYSPEAIAEISDFHRMISARYLEKIIALEE